MKKEQSENEKVWHIKNKKAKILKKSTEGLEDSHGRFPREVNPKGKGRVNKREKKGF